VVTVIDRPERVNFDVAVIGGGPAGSAAAMSLARAGRTVALIERSNYGDLRIGETLPPSVKHVLASVAPELDLRRDGHVPAAGISSAWGEARPSCNDFLRNPYGNGWHVDRGHFDRALGAFAENAGVTLFRQTAVVGCECIEHGWRVILRGEKHATRELGCTFVIDASGRRATDIKRRAGKRSVHDKLIGILAFSHRGDVADGRTLIEAAPRGWWYSTVLPNDLHVTVYMTDVDTVNLGECERIRLLQRELADAPLTRARWKRLGSLVRIALAPAMTIRHETVVGRNWLLAGDAAMTWDPLSGQGVCKALESGMRGANAVACALDGDDTGIEEYALWTDTRFREYLASRSKYYCAEQRWPDSVFWRRRHELSRHA
jgi:flavin-dependent dehydrogenase